MIWHRLRSAILGHQATLACPVTFQLSARNCAWLRTISPPDCCAAWCQVCYWRTTVSGRERSREPRAVYRRWLGNPANHGTSAEFRDTIFLDKAQNQQCCGLKWYLIFWTAWMGMQRQFFLFLFFFPIFASEEVLSMSQAEQFQSESIDLVI